MTLESVTWSIENGASEDLLETVDPVRTVVKFYSNNMVRTLTIMATSTSKTSVDGAFDINVEYY